MSEKRIEVETGLGRVAGLEADGVRVFRGIPYARPPVGERRFRAPEAPEPWTGVRDATRFGPSAPQPKLALAALPGMDVGEQSEDCLYLNVYAPSGASAQARKPVMVWIHGGGFVLGSGSQAVYDARALARRGDVVVVTINYRVGCLGWMDLGDQGDLAVENAGLLDQIAALRWVREHVERFGGDRENVTIFGESAGGMSVGTLMGCPAAQGLFHKAIPQSGSCQAVHADRDGSAAVTAAMLSALGLSSPHVRHLREVPVEKLLAAQQQVSLRLMLAGGKHLLPFQPVVDGRVLPRHPLDQVAEGAARHVPLLVGTTLDEWKLFGFMDTELRQLDDVKLAARIQQRVAHADGARIAAGYRASRPQADGASLWIAIETDRVFRVPAIRLAEAQLRVNRDVFMYLYTWASPAFGGVLGACHAIELPFLFDVLDAPGAENFAGKGPEATRLSGWTMGAWAAFAHRGNPSHPGLGEWPRYDLSRRATMELGAQAGVLDDPAADERRLWDGAL
jgi:para-nitrobenzyl esterase